MDPIDNLENGIIVASRVSRSISLDAADSAVEWQLAAPVRFSMDWHGLNPDPALETEVRILWHPQTLYLRFVCRYRELFVFDDSAPNSRRDHLWDRDVVEVFLQPPDLLAKGTYPGPRDNTRYYGYYKELEIAPNGMWLDLEIAPSGAADLKSSLTRSVHVDAEEKIWAAELTIPMRSLTPAFDPGHDWRANFYRVEGKAEPRKYLAWQPTRTHEPNFHVPEAFGQLRFES